MAKAKSATQLFSGPVSPMLALSVKEPFTDPEWLYEIKWEGYRVIAQVRNGKTTLYSSKGEDLTDTYKLIVNEFEGQPDLIVDGEVVVLDQDGKPDYNALQHYNGKGDLVYYIFDLLYYEDESYLNKPLIQRKEMLLHVIKKESILTYNDHFDNGIGLSEQIKKLGLEGIVAKKKESIYKPGEQSKDWLTVKIVKRQQEKKVTTAVPDVYADMIKEIARIRAKRARGG